MGKKKQITATVCLYSGRQNPQWNLTQKDYNKLLLVIKGLPKAKLADQASVLGYSGISVNTGEQKVFAFNELITMISKKLPKGYIDKGRSIERQLLRTAPGKIKMEIKGMLPEGLV